MPVEPQIQVSGPERLSQRAQIEQALEHCRSRNEGLRIRIPIMLYDHRPESRQYANLRDGAWNLQLAQETTPTDLEHFIHTLGRCLDAIASEGTAAVLSRLGEGPDQLPEPTED